MVSGLTNLVSPALKGQLLALNRTARTLDASQQKLATGRRVNSALDNPNNFFTSLSLRQEANGLGRLLDSLGQTLQTLRLTSTALQSVQDNITQANELAQEAKQEILSSRQDVGDVILADDPVVYYRMNDANTNIVNNFGTGGNAMSGRYQGGVTLENGPLHQGVDNASVSFDGVNDRIRIANNVELNRDLNGYAQRTVELTFQASVTTGRQVLFEAGGNGNNIGASIYLDEDEIYFTAFDPSEYGPFNISTKIEAGTVYHAAFVFDLNTNSFTGYLNGEVVGTATVNAVFGRHGTMGVGRATNGAVYHDGVVGGNNNYFEGFMSDLAIYNDALTQEQLQAHFEATQLETTRFYESEISALLTDVDPTISDSSYRGVNLLSGDDISTYLDTDFESSLTIQGRDFSLLSLGVSQISLQTSVDLELSSRTFEGAAKTIREYQTSLSHRISIIETRQQYNQERANTKEAGSDDLTILDQNEESANLVSLSIRQAVQTQTLALTGRQVSIADFLGRSSPF